MVGAGAIIFGTFEILRGNNLVPNFKKFRNYKPMIQIAHSLYMIAINLGIWVYVSWFVTNPIRLSIDELQHPTTFQEFAGI